MLRTRLGPASSLPDYPLVSLVVLNCDGAPHLRKLVAGLAAHTDYPRIEIVLVDNGSSDDSVAFARNVDTPFPISILANAHNESFSDACNQGAALATGELLLFANNDLEPFEDGWLRELVACQRRRRAGVVAATLLYRDERTATAEYGHLVQHRGIRFRPEDRLVRPVLHGYGDHPLDEELGRDAPGSAVAAACMLMERDLFEAVDGFTHGYVYGAEDVDLCLKVRAAGREVVCSGRSVIVHHAGSTRRTAAFEVRRERQLRNRRLLWERWGPRIRREYDLDLLDRSGGWAETRSAPAEPLPDREHVLSPGICLKVAADAAELAEAIGAGLTEAGRRALVVRAEQEDEDLDWLNYDVAVHLRGRSRFMPVPGQFNVLWYLSDREPSFEEASRYDLVLVDDEESASRLRGTGGPAVVGLAAEPCSAAALVEVIGAQVEAQRFPIRIGGAGAPRGQPAVAAP